MSYKHDDDITPSEPPPSYAEALNSAPVLPERPNNAPPPMPQRPSLTSNLSYNQRPPLQNFQNQSYGRPGANQSSQGNINNQYGTTSTQSGYNSGTNPGTGSSLNSNNPNLPFLFPRGHYCRKCLNSGFKLKNGKVCHDCWDSLFLNRNAYNPNPNLLFKYPKRFICEKCLNTGVKRKNGLSCQDCYSRFAPRNHVSLSYGGGFGFLDFLSSGYGSGYGSRVPPNAIRVPPGDPRLGGILCGSCRGTGQVTFFLDQDLCDVCGGLGRILNTQPQQSGYYR